MDTEKTVRQLKSMTDEDLKWLVNEAQKELSNRIQYLSNMKNTPSEQCQSLNEFFGNAWIHG